VGFSITKLRLLDAGSAGSNPPSHLGIAVAAVGLLVIGVSLGRFLQQRRNIELADFRPQVALDALFLASVAVGGMIILVLALGK
jgi:uncharacterized membrane protein YidH (DUF202 family)